LLVYIYLVRKILWKTSANYKSNCLLIFRFVVGLRKVKRKKCFGWDLVFSGSKNCLSLVTC